MPHASTARTANKIARFAGRSALAIAVVIAVYCVAALVGSILPRNPDWQSAKQGIPIFIESNGVHTSIVVPIGDLSDLVGNGLAADRIATHVGLGWGEARVFRHTRTWADLSLRDAWGAATGSDETLVHVDYYYRPAPTDWRRRIVLSVSQYRRLIAILRGEFARPGDDGETGYTPEDHFYPGKGRYHALKTCNVWTADILARAGIAAPHWTPFAGGVMRRFPRAPLAVTGGTR